MNLDDPRYDALLNDRVAPALINAGSGQGVAGAYRLYVEFLRKGCS